MGRNQRYTKRVRYRADTSPHHPSVITGDRTPSTVALMSFFALYQGHPLTASQIAVRINCPPANVLIVLRQLEVDGAIRRSAVDHDQSDVTARWARA